MNFQKMVGSDGFEPPMPRRALDLQSSAISLSANYPKTHLPWLPQSDSNRRPLAYWASVLTN